MHNIFHTFIIRSTPEKIYEAISSPAGLEAWWPDHCRLETSDDALYHFDFGPEYQWTAVASVSEPGKAFEFTLLQSDKDWEGTRVGFRLQQEPEWVQVEFYHTGWPESNAHFRISSFCWAMYLRLLKKYLEEGTVVPYKQRLEV